MIYRKEILTLLMIYLFSAQWLHAQETIDITVFGAIPNSNTDVRPALQQALASVKGKRNITLKFPKGRYDFWPSVTKGQTDNIGFELSKCTDLTIDGEGSEFIFHGLMQIANIDSCSNIIMRNFSIDWDRPLISQAEIVEASTTHLDVRIDRKSYPYVIENDTIKFYGEDWKYPVLELYNNLYDKNSKEILYNTWDAPLGIIFQKRAEQLPGGIVRFHGVPNTYPEPGTMVTLFHRRYAVNGICIQNSKTVLLKDIQIYHALSNGVLGVRSENISLDNISMLVNEKKKRVFSIIADASHFVHCKGTIKIENCAHTGQGDDFVNVHGKNVKIAKIADRYTIETEMTGWCTPGDTLWFINPTNMQREEVRVVNTSEQINDQQQRSIGCRIVFTTPLPANITKGYFAENKTWTARLELRNCKILKRNRARGILVTTPKDVIIENNYFNTAGTAILIEGDSNYWFESGGNNNVHIRNNVFDNCLTSGNKHGDRGEWGEAIITITPSHTPQSVKDKAYHKNISIYNNIFKVFDTPLIRAISVDGLKFEKNEIIRTFDYQPYTWQKTSFQLNGCRNVSIKSNQIDKNYQTRIIQTEHMKKRDVHTDTYQGFKHIY